MRGDYVETLLTKQLKYRMLFFKPFNNPNMSTIRYATDVTTSKNGIVDVIRFEDWNIKTEKTFKKCKLAFKYLCPDTSRDCESCPHYGTFNEYEHNIMVTCFEIRISLSDFKSKNGDNFVGNRNYYVVPLKLYPKIKDNVPNEIGIISVNTDGIDHQNLDASAKVHKECKIRDISDKDKLILLYNALKNWVNGSSGKEYKEIIDFYEEKNQDERL